MNYKKIYSAANSTEAHLIQGLLEQASIDATLSGENLTIAAGALPADVFQVEILVDEDKYSEALKIVSNYEEILKLPVRDSESWECKECKKVNPDTFEMCWSCQANRMTVT